MYWAGKQNRRPWDGLGVQSPGHTVCGREPRTHRAATAWGVVVSSDSHLGQMRAMRGTGVKREMRSEGSVDWGCHGGG